MNERRQRFLDMAAELAETAMTLARDVAAKALATDKLDEKIALGQAYEKLARSVRLSIALAERLERNDRQAAFDGLAPPQRARRAEVAFRKDAIRTAVRRSIRQETEGETVERLDAALDLAIEEYALSPRFTIQPMIDIVDLMRDALRLPRDPKLGLPWEEGEDAPVPS